MRCWLMLKVKENKESFAIMIDGMFFFFLIITVQSIVINYNNILD